MNAQTAALNLLPPAPQSYAEARGKMPINWWDRINQLEREFPTGDPRDDDDGRRRMLWSDLFWPAMTWPTCACGNQCAAIPRGYAGVPEDFKLQRLGTRFPDCLIVGNYDAARETLRQIELRSAELLRQPS